MSPGQAEPRYDGRAQSRPEQTEEERARAEALRKWKEGDSPKEEKKRIFWYLRPPLQNAEPRFLDIA